MVLLTESSKMDGYTLLFGIIGAALPTNIAFCYTRLFTEMCIAVAMCMQQALLCGIALVPVADPRRSIVRKELRSSIVADPNSLLRGIQ